MSAEATTAISHWSKMLEGVTESTQRFYGAVEQAVQARKIEGIRFGRVEYKEGGFFSAKREYLRVERADLLFDICGSPFGSGFFVSWWLQGTQSGWGAFLKSMGAKAGNFYDSFVKPDTYYRSDTAAMYRELVHGAVLEVVDTLIHDQHAHPMLISERKPVMREFYQ